MLPVGVVADCTNLILYRYPELQRVCAMSYNEESISQHPRPPSSSYTLSIPLLRYSLNPGVEVDADVPLRTGHSIDTYSQHLDQ